MPVVVYTEWVCGCVGVCGCARPRTCVKGVREPLNGEPDYVAETDEDRVAAAINEDVSHHVSINQEIHEFLRKFEVRVVLELWVTEIDELLHHRL